MAHHLEATENSAALSQKLDWQSAIEVSKLELGSFFTAALLADGTVATVELGDTRLLFWGPKKQGVIGIKVSPIKAGVITQAQDGSIFIGTGSFDSPSLAVLRPGAETIDLLPDPEVIDFIDALKATTDRKLVVAGSSPSPNGSPKILIIDDSSGQTESILEGHEAGILDLDVDSFGHVVSGSADQTVRVWNMRTGQEVRRFEHDDSVSSVAFARNGDIVAGDFGGSIRIWPKLRSGKERVYRPYGETKDYKLSSIHSVAVGADGTVFAGSRGGRIFVVPSSREGIGELPEKHRGTVRELIVTPKERLVSIGVDHTIRTWVPRKVS